MPHGNSSGTSPVQARGSRPFSDEERRKENRRQNDRQGKYDRRRNRCIHCRHFEGDANEEMGYCQYHHTEMAAQAFACPHFDPISKDSLLP